MAGGSDAPIETCSPLMGMFDAIHRQARPSLGDDETSHSNSALCPSLSAPEREIFRAEERLTFSEALWIYTTGAAFAAGCEGFLGCLEVGYVADFVVLDAAVLEQNSLLATTEPELVVVGGAVSYQRDIEKEVSSVASTDADSATPMCTVAMGGPYIPGKNGKLSAPKKRNRVDSSSNVKVSYTPSCACRLLGRYCAAAYL